MEPGLQGALSLSPRGDATGGLPPPALGSEMRGVGLKALGSVQL